MFNQFGYGSGARGGARKHGGPAAELARIPQRSSDDRIIELSEEPRVFVLGGNLSTLAVVNNFLPEGGAITARLVPIAWTPAGVVTGDAWQNVGIALNGLFDWVDRTFPPEDDRAFIAPMRDVELLARIGWHAPLPEKIDDSTVLNIEDVPEEIAEGLAHPPAAIVQCAACRRLCVRDEFVWKEKQLCAWDYHGQVFGRRGPWRNGPYEERHFETLPTCAYVAPPLLAEIAVEAVLVLTGIEEATARQAIDVVLAADAERPHLAVRTEGGFTVLREMPE
ncbi:MAG: hypothetical protein JO192_08250 [Candidatus Eremiobacteraeota bacterium]|nr:hypothetical protein [Candidatus Eremiobacteraeota bacterium]MBV8721425.1 hypothetical protein [Candidatus Eremiobacteraeota bacterium]